MNWNAINTIATIISTVAFVLTAVYIRDQLKGQQRDRYLSITSDLYGVWQSRDFSEMQLWLIHKLQVTSWQDFIASHRGEYGEIAFHRVGSFYDRVGTLVRLGFVDDREILATIGGYAIAVWNKIEPLVKEARRIENSNLFVDFERILPSCRECYVPGLDSDAPVNPFSLQQPEPEPTVSPEELKLRLDQGYPLTLIDARHPDQVKEDPRTLPRALLIPADQIHQRYDTLQTDRPAIVFCA
jgi:hypothetical protein